MDHDDEQGEVDNIDEMNGNARNRKCFLNKKNPKRGNRATKPL